MKLRYQLFFDQHQVVIVVGLVLIILPYLISAGDVYIPVTDNMDSNVAWWKSMKDSKTLFVDWDKPVPGMLLENPRFTYPSVWSEEGLIYASLPIFWGYVILKSLIFLFAYYGFRFWIRRQKDLNIANQLEPFICLLWGSLAFYVHRGIGIAALPLVVGIFQDFFRGQSKGQYYWYLIVYAFFSKLTLTGLYVWVGLAVWWFWILVDKRRPKSGFAPFWALSSMALAWSIQEHQLIHGLFFNPGYISHRQDFSYDFGVWANQMPWDFILSGDQNGVFYSPFYLVAIVFFALISLKNAPSFRKGRTNLILIASIALLLSIISIFGLGDFLGGLLPLFSSVNLFRFEYWIPFLLFSTFVYWWEASRFRFKIPIISFFLTLNILAYQYEWRYLINSYLHILPQRVPTFNEYYSTEQWEEIQEKLVKDSKNPKILHFNIPPAVSAFNGLKSLDGYIQIYSQEKKSQTYKVVQKELEKDPSLRDHLLKWGNKCYFQNAQYPDDYFMYKWRAEDPLDEPDFDYQYLRDSLGATHILSALPIITHQLRFVEKFEDESSAWNVYLYSLDSVSF